MNNELTIYTKRYEIDLVLLIFLTICLNVSALFPILERGVKILDIAALSIALSQSNTSQSAGIALTKKALDTAEGNSAQLLKMMEAPHPNLGGSIDVKA